MSNPLSMDTAQAIHALRQGWSLRKDCPRIGRSPFDGGRPSRFKTDQTTLRAVPAHRVEGFKTSQSAHRVGGPTARRV